MGNTLKNSQVKADIKGVVGLQVKRLRSESSLTQQALAEKCNIFRTYLSRIENGSANPTITVVSDLASVLNVEVAELFKE
jgi:transcriptional regulator with XRE-family HTH domain